MFAGYTGAAALTVACEAPAETKPESETGWTGVSPLQDENGNLLRDSEFRYMGFTGRVARVLAFTANKVRYLGYSSDIGESARPLLNPKYVKLFYGVTWTYVFADVGYNGYQEQQKGSPPAIVARTALQVLTFQSLASVALPTLIIHTIVHQTQKLCVNMPGKAKTYVPVAAGLVCIPLLPFVDEPAEELIHLGFNRLWPLPEGSSH